MKREKNERPAKSIPARNSDPAVIRWLTLTIFFGILLLNSLLLTKNYYWDGIFFAQKIEDAPRLDASLIHPNHLIDQIIQYALYRGTRLLGFHARALTVLQMGSAVFSATAAALLYRIAFRSFESLYVSLVLTAVFAFSASWWKFSTDADTYILAVLLLLICVWIVLPERKPRPFLLALVHAFAMFAHQLAVFYFPVAIVGLVLQTNHAARWRNCLKYVVTVLLMMVGVYLAAFYLATGSFSISRFASWTTSFSPEHGFTFNVWTNLAYTLRSHARLFFGGRLTFVRELKGPATVSLAGLALLAVTAFLIMLLRYPRELKSGISAALTAPRRFHALTILCVIWILPYLLFLFVFIPQNTFYRLFYLPAIVLLGGAFLTSAESAPGHVRRYRAACFAAAMACSNLAFSQYPYTQTRANPPLEFAVKLNQIWKPGTIVYFALPNSDESLVRYFNPATVWVQTTPGDLIQQFSSLPATGQSVWLETTMIDAFQQTPAGREWLERHAIQRSDSALVGRKFRIQYWQLRAESFDRR